MAQNHVWRYTLRIFHTFASFKICLKIGLKNDHPNHDFLIEKQPPGEHGLPDDAILVTSRTHQKIM